MPHFWGQRSNSRSNSRPCYRHNSCRTNWQPGNHCRQNSTSHSTLCTHSSDHRHSSFQFGIGCLLSRSGKLHSKWSNRNSNSRTIRQLYRSWRIADQWICTVPLIDSYPGRIGCKTRLCWTGCNWKAKGKVGSCLYWAKTQGSNSCIIHRHC